QDIIDDAKSFPCEDSAAARCWQFLCHSRVDRSHNPGSHDHADGTSPLDLVSGPVCISHGEDDRKLPAYARDHERLAPFSRLIRSDKRGTGLSDRVSITEFPSWRSAWTISSPSWTRSARSSRC